MHYHHEDEAEVSGVSRALRNDFEVQNEVFPAQSGGRNTLRVGVV